MSSPLARRLWGVHLLGLAAVTVATLAGFWQLGSWQAVRDAEARDLSQAAPVPLEQIYGPDDPFPAEDVGRPVQASGTWVTEATVYVGGRAHEGTDGYWAVTPLAVGAPDGPAIPVVRGWVESPAAAPPAPSGAGEVVGYLQPGEGTGEMDEDSGDDVLPQLRIADLIQHVDQDLYGGYVIAENGIDGLPAADPSELPKVSALSGLRNFLYAVEWWLFALLALYMWWRYVREATTGEVTADRADERSPATS